MLQGIRVIEIEGLGPAPFAAMMLADLGAEVVVIHRPGGTNQTVGDANLLDRGKKSIALDLKNRGDAEIAKALISHADAVIEGFRPGVMERLGLGPEAFAQANPKLVYGRMTGWGQNGPKSLESGHDLNYIAMSGALWYASEAGAPPVTPPTLVGDIGGGALYLVAGVLAGLLQAAKTGKGTVVDAAIVDGSAHMMALLMSMAPSGNLLKERGKSLLDGPHWSRSYVCADERHITVQCLEPKFYRTFLEIMGLDGDPMFESQYDARKWPDQTTALSNIFITQSMVYWADRFKGSEACVAPVLAPAEAAQDPHMTARDVWREVEGMLQPAPAPRFDGAAQATGSIPQRDGNRVEILQSLPPRTGH